VTRETLDHAADGWVGLRDAASALGLSVHAVRRRLRSGELAGRQIETKFGHAWLVQVDRADGNAAPAQPLRPPSEGAAQPLRSPGDTPSATPYEGGGDASLAGLVELVRELQGEVVRRSEAAAMWQARAEFLAGQLEVSRAEVKALAAPQQAVEASGAPESPEPPTETPRWKRWLLAIYG